MNIRESYSRALEQGTLPGTGNTAEESILGAATRATTAGGALCRRPPPDTAAGDRRRRGPCRPPPHPRRCHRKSGTQIGHVYLIKTLFPRPADVP